jgi:hypothetical protein
MLSVIICSVNEELLSNIKRNIASTIGLEYELLVWDNKGKNYGLCKVYNSMAGKARYPYVCFIHEDIIFETPNWGKIVLEIFVTKKEIGLLGVAGGKYKGKYLSGWFSGIKGMDYFHIIHKNKNNEQNLSNSNQWETPEVKVVTIDGVFMCARKFVWEMTKFNEDLLKGFHFYDIDFSLQVARSYEVIVTNRIDIIHLTQGGDFGNNWVKEALSFHTANSNVLPFYCEKVNAYSAEQIVAKTWLDRLKTERINLGYKLKWINVQHLYKVKALWPFVVKFLLYKPSGIAFIHDLLKKYKGQILNKK